MECAEGTRCVPSGLTEDFRIEHDGSVNGESGTGGGGDGGFSVGPRGSLSLPALMVVGGLWLYLAALQ